MSDPLPPFSPDEVEHILRFVPAAPDNELWVKLCASVCSEIGEDDGLRVLRAWSPDFGDKSTATVIRSFKGAYKSTIATLIDEAKKHGFDASAYQRERAAKLRAEAAKPPASVRNEKSYTQKKSDSAAPSLRSEKTDTPPRPRERRGNAAKPPASTAGKLVPVVLGKCSICESWNAPQSVRETELRACLEAVKAGEWREAVEAVRAGKREKSTLPQICAYGVYRNRRLDGNLQSRSGFLARCLRLRRKML